MSTLRKILIVDDEISQRQLLGGFLAKHGYEVASAGNGEEALALYHESFAPVAVVDMKMPGMNGIELLRQLREVNPFVQVIVLTAFGSVGTAVEAMKAGAFDYLTKPVEDLDELLIKLDRASRQNHLVRDHAVLRERVEEVFPTTELIGDSKPMQQVNEMIARVATRDVTVLVTGPSGTGKELVVRSIHALSDRAENRLVAINCAAFPENLLEAELFGYEKGAFTGAEKTKQGRFELADGGTLFLDEIGEMPLSMQVKLLRVLEDRHIQRLGSVKEIPLDIRIIAATNRELKKLVAEKSFREDLYYRLNVVAIDMPSLAERGGDILLLAEHFLKRFAVKVGKQVTGIDTAAAGLLTEYTWPGNVRELENMIERAVVMSMGDCVNVEDLTGLNAVHRTEDDSSDIQSLADMEKEHISECLARQNWNMKLCAETLGIHRNTLRSKIKEYGLSQD